MSKEELEMKKIEKINLIFEKIFNEFGDKMKSKKYISKSSLEQFLDNSETPKMSREKIEEGAFFVIQRPLCYLELIDNKDENNNYENNNNGNNINNLYQSEASGNNIENINNNNGDKINNKNNINNRKNDNNENKNNYNENDKINKENKINNGNILINEDKAEAHINEIDKGNKVNNENNNNNINNNNDNNNNNNNINNINDNNNENNNNKNNQNKKIDIEFLVKVKFKDDEKKEISFWVCSLEYLKEQLMNLGYKEAKIIKKKKKKTLFSENEEQENKDKESGAPSSESLEDNDTNLDDELFENEVRLSKNPLNIGNIFNSAQNIFNPLVNMDNIKDYLYDLNLQKQNYEKLILNEEYFNYLKDIWKINHKNNIYCYNQLSGVTFSLLQILEQKREVFGTRYFHFNCEKIDKYKKKYFYFKLAKLFKKDEKELYNKIIKSKGEEIINHDIKYMTDILIEVLKKFENIFIIFDNIKEDNIFTRVKKIINDLKSQEDIKNFTSLMFIQINSSTMYLIEYNINSFSMILPIESSYKAKLPLKEYVNRLLMGNENDKNGYIEKYKKKIEKIILDIKDDSIDYLVFLIKLLYKDSFKENNNFLDYNAYDYLIKFLPFLFIFLCQKYYNMLSINKIQYRVDIIKEIISNKVNLLLSQKMLSDKIFSQIKTKSTEGIYIEKEIIYFLITENIGFDKIKIEKIYCFNSNLEKQIKNSEIIFIQELESSPLYDFGIIIIIDGEPTFKGYQIGINKPRKSLLNLSKNKIKMDILYFISKINEYLTQKITKFSFGIITTINAYYAQNNKESNNIYENVNDNENDDENDNENDNYPINEDKKEEENDNEYKNFKIMKNFCNANNYEFIIFSPEEKKFYVDEGDSLKNIAFNQYSNSKFTNNVGNYIFSNENNLNLNKLPLYPNEITKKDKEYIWKCVEEIKNKQLIFIGKFENKNLIMEDIQNNNFNELIDNNYLIYAKDKNKKIIFFKKKYFRNEFQNFEIFYIFDTSLDINKRGRKKKNNDLENINIDSSLNLKEEKEELLKKKRKREEDEESENSDM